MAKTSAKQRIICFMQHLPAFLKDQETHKANRRQGTRPSKKGGRVCL